MNFAVIEYASKSGDIWRHTDERPNFLADPEKEIDTTSFGCYVSALKGEHIPLTKLIGANKLTNRLRRKVTGTWPQNYSLEYLSKFDVLMVVYDLHRGQEMTRFVERLAQAKKNGDIKAFILGVPTQPFGQLAEAWQSNPDSVQEIKEFMAACDVFLTVVGSTKDTWQSMTNTPVAYLPQPYPVEYATRYAKPRQDKKDILFVAGVTSRPNILLGHDVARVLQEKFPQYLIHVTNTPGLTLDTSHLKQAKYEVTTFLPWQQQLAYLSEVALVINTDYTQTRGRVQVDCAAAGTPSIGADSDGQVDLYPTLPANPDTSIETLVEQATELLTNNTRYQEIVTHATAALTKYNYPHTVDRLTNLVQSHE